MSFSGHWPEESPVGCRGYHQSAKAREPCHQSQSVDDLVQSPENTHEMSLGEMLDSLIGFPGRAR